MPRMRRLSIKKPSDCDTPEVNLTPLIDVVFVVLISFILIAPLLQLEQIDLASGGETTKPLTASGQNRMQISIRCDDAIYLGKSRVSDQQLIHLLKSSRSLSHQKSPPRVFCDKRASFGTYQLVKLALERAGFEEMELILTPANRQGQ